MTPQTVREAELQEEVTQLRRLLHVESDRVALSKVMVGLNLSKYEAMILLALYDAGNAWLPTERLEMALPYREEPRDRHNVAVHIHRIRGSLGPDAILNRLHVGYTIGGPGILACRRVLVPTDPTTFHMKEG